MRFTFCHCIEGSGALSNDAKLRGAETSFQEISNERAGEIASRLIQYNI